MELKKSTVKLLGVLVLLVVAGAFMFGGFESSVAGTGNVVVNNGEFQEVVLGMKDFNYYPNTFEVEAGKTVRLSMDETSFGCFRDFTIREFNVRKYLQTPSDYVEFVPDKPGTYTFACSMGMGYGKMIVK